MARRWRVALMVLALALAVWSVGQAQTKVSTFQILVEPSATGLKAVCVSGCAWKDLSYSCEKTLPCKAQIDQLGVGRAPAK